MKKLMSLLATTLFILQNAVWANTIDSGTEIIQANIHYQNRQYREAMEIYDRLARDGYMNGHLYYNKGNAHYRLGEFGLAIHSYLKAKTLIPRDKDVDANLKSALQETVDHLEGKSKYLWGLSWLDDFNLQELFQGMITINLLFWTSLIGWIYFKTGFWDLARRTLLVLLIVSLMSTATKLQTDAHDLSGVILAKTADIKSSPGETVTLFQLHEGAVVAVVGNKEGWCEIELPDGKRGWVKKESIVI